MKYTHKKLPLSLAITHLKFVWQMENHSSNLIKKHLKESEPPQT